MISNAKASRLVGKGAAVENILRKCKSNEGHKEKNLSGVIFFKIEGLSL
jgi:hypothetical protein